MQNLAERRVMSCSLTAFGVHIYINLAKVYNVLKIIHAGAVN